MSPKLVFIHGWSFNSTMWDPLISKLSGFDCHTIDLGFIAGGKTTWPDVREPAIYIGHSLGVLWLLNEWQQSDKSPKPEAIISIAGFTNFTKFTDRRVLAFMQRGLKKQPEAQLNQFWQQAGVEQTSLDELSQKQFDQQQLSQGLAWLATLDGAEQFKNLTCPKLILASKADKIVPPEGSAGQWPDETIIWHDTTPHILPLADPDWLAIKIEDFLKTMT